MGRSPVFVLGLDGAAWPVVQPLIDKGALPFLGSLVDNGAWGTLEAPWPWATFPSWTSIMTGTTQGVHGLLDFSELDPATMHVRFVDSTWRRVPAIWQLATTRGKRSVVLGVPGTYPPDRDVELMISGFDTPVTTSIDPTFVWPPDFRTRLFREVGRFPLTPVQELRIGKGWHRKALAALLESIQGKTRVARFVLEELHPDLFVMVFGESDTVCHHFWHFADPRSPRAEPGLRPELRTAIEQVYTALDSALSEIVQSSRLAPTVLLVSDHGFGGAGSTALHLNRFLASHGFLTFGSRAALPAVFSSVPATMLPFFPRTLQQWVFRKAGSKMIPRLEGRRRFAGILWQETLAYSEELNYAPAIRINLRGRERGGVVAPEKYEEVRERITAALRAWRDKRTGEPVVRRIFRREELIQGPAVEKAPDLLLELHAPGGYSYVVLPSEGKTEPVQEEIDSAGSSGAKGRGMHGSHRREGFFVVSGKGISRGALQNPVQAHQVAGIVLAELGLSLPSWISLPPPGVLMHEPEIEAGEEHAQRGELVDRAGDLAWERTRRLKDLGYL